MTGASAWMAASLPGVIASSATPPFLVEGAALLVAAAVIAYICYRIGLVPIIGFLVAGVVIGPYGLGVVANRELVDAVAEIGVILLLFTIGLEFSLERLAKIFTLILGGGSLQVGLASVVTMGVLMAIGVDWRPALFTGFLVALSSTAIVLKLFADRGETNTTRGQVALGLLIFQDLAVIVMVLVVPMLGVGVAHATGDATAAAVVESDALTLAKALGTAVALIVVVLVVARRFMPPLLERVARTCSPELFLLTVVAICFGTAFLTSLAGVSVSLGAFLGGLIVSESEFREHAFTEIMPLQILFSATFFVSVGMLLNLGFVMTHFPLVLGAVAVVCLIKIVTSAAAVAVIGYDGPTAAAAALALAQVGEFSFVLERAGRDVGLTPAGMGEAGSQAFIAATVLLMVATPFLTGVGARIAKKIEKRQTIVDAETMVPEPLPEVHAARLQDHVIVAGYGNAARQLVRVLHGSQVPYVITTLSPGGAEEAESEGLPVIRGDASKQLTLQHAGIQRAKMIVIPDDDPATAHRIATIARQSSEPGTRIIVRTRYLAEIEPLTKAGADRVVAEELESIVQLFAEVLRNYQVPPEEIERHEATIRRGGYAALRDEGVPDTPVVVCSIPGGCAPDGTPLTPAVEERAMRRKIDTQQKVTLETHVSKAECAHLDQIRPVFPSAAGCEDCLRTGDSWVHLRICMTCGHMGCCDSSPNRHATKHHHQTGHPIVRSMEPGEEWGWCYADEVVV
jgi:CPA2 family monovalent cation:H+ antiporter-2